MIIESITIIFFALAIDFTLGDPKNKFHPTAWIGSLIAKLTPSLKNSSDNLEKLGGIILIVISCTIVVSLIIFLDVGINLITIDYLSVIISVISKFHTSKNYNCYTWNGKTCIGCCEFNY